MRNILFPLLLAVGVVGGLLLGGVMRPRPGATMPVYQGRQVAANPDEKIGYTISLINQLYVDSVNLDSLTEVIMPMLMAELDPHSVYIPARDLARANESLEGEFEGIGVVFNMITDTAIVLNVVPGGPSEKAGILSGDRIININDTLVAGNRTPQDDVVRMLRGKGGTPVRLSIERMRLGELIPITVVRGKVPVKSLDAAFMIRPEIAYVKLSAFSKNTHAEVTAALSRFREEGMNKVILDLRGNSGGYMDQAINLVNDFLSQGDLIVYTVDRNKRRVEEYANGKGRYTDVGLAVIIDEESASASEIMAGAVQDNDRGIIVGRRSYGKGLVQQPVMFRDGSGMRLTIARYYTPSGRSIQKPYDNGTDEYYGDIYNRYMHEEFFTADSIRFTDSLKYTTKAGRTVYGGGGIMPDVFVPMDTTGMSRYYIEVAGRNIIYRYTLEYTDRHREEVNAVRTVPELMRMLDADTLLMKKFVEYAAENGVKPDAKGLELSGELIEAQIRAFVGRNTALEESGFYANIYTQDNTIMAAIKALEEQ